ncbi:MAG: LysM peptidoglycan-binding domain-containing protein [Clostridiales bacterium]|nr:LysM peptidoglycan-binding domain-containing protein [Clostridiales bacterium]
MATIQYIVQPGDTLWNIAQLYNTTVNDIARYNGISDPDQIMPGQKLRIFVSDDTIPEWYVVREGDTLGDIAHRFHTTVDNLVALNGLRNPDIIYPRRVLRIRP